MWKFSVEVFHGSNYIFKGTYDFFKTRNNNGNVLLH